MEEQLKGKTKYYNNRKVTVLREEGHGFVFVAAELNIDHNITGSNFCHQCNVGGFGTGYLGAHTCDISDEVIEYVMENIEDHEVFWVPSIYLKDEPFELKPFQELVDKIAEGKNQLVEIEDSISKRKEDKINLLKEIQEKTSTLSDLTLKIQQAQHELMECLQEEGHQINSIPEQLSNGHINISSSEFLELLERKLILQSLQNGGVDNWEWYDESLGDTDFENEALINLSAYLKR